METSLIDRLRESASQALAEQPVLFAYLFGSVALGKNRPDSDIDIAVYVEETIRKEDFLAHSLEVVEELSKASGLGFIEVTILNDAPLRLRGRAISERIVIYSRDEPFRVRYESATMREFMDFQFRFKSLDEQFLRDTAEGRR